MTTTTTTTTDGDIFPIPVIADSVVDIGALLSEIVVVIAIVVIAVTIIIVVVKVREWISITTN